MKRGRLEAWQCEACTLINASSEQRCEACEGPRPEPSRALCPPSAVSHGCAADASARETIDLCESDSGEQQGGDGRIEVEGQRGGGVSPVCEAPSARSPHVGLPRVGSEVVVNSSFDEQMDAIRKRRAEQFRLSASIEGDREPKASYTPLGLLSFNVWFQYPETFGPRMAEVGRLADIGK